MGSGIPSGYGTAPPAQPIVPRVAWVAQFVVVGLSMNGLLGGHISHRQRGVEPAPARKRLTD
jgi:hypothetical protein